MFFATTAQPLIRRQAYAQSGRALERFMDEALRSTSSRSCSYTQDDSAFMLSLDLPGIAKDQLIERAIDKPTFMLRISYLANGKN